LNWGSIPHLCCESLRIDIPSACYDRGLSDAWFSFFDKRAKSKGWTLRWDPNESIVIHVRLEDIAPPLASPGEAQLNDQWTHQQYMGDANLKRLVQHLHHLYPEKKIYIITSPVDRDIERCRRITEKLPGMYGIIADHDVDYALWQMMCCDILVMSKSTFGMIAGFCHQGTQCFMFGKFIHFLDVLGKYDTGRWKWLELPDKSDDSTELLRTPP